MARVNSHRDDNDMTITRKSNDNTKLVVIGTVADYKVMSPLHTKN